MLEWHSPFELPRSTSLIRNFCRFFKIGPFFDFNYPWYGVLRGTRKQIRREMPYATTLHLKGFNRTLKSVAKTESKSGRRKITTALNCSLDKLCCPRRKNLNSNDVNKLFWIKTDTITNRIKILGKIWGDVTHFLDKLVISLERSLQNIKPSSPYCIMNLLISRDFIKVDDFIKLLRHINTLYLHVANLLNVNNEPPATLNANTPVINVTTILSPSVRGYIPPLVFNKVNADTNKWLTTT